jgi:hypothetical protein
MPLGDRTGPLGMGPRTGRGMGYCGGLQMPGAVNTAPGRGLGGRGRGGGHGWRHRFYATGLTGWQRAAMAWRRGGFGMPYPMPFGAPLITREQELSLLRDDLRCLEQTAENLRRMIAELNAEAAEKDAAETA